MAVEATIYQGAVSESAAYTVLRVLHLALVLLQFTLLRRGFLAVQQSAGMPANVKAVTALLVWYAVTVLLGAIHYRGLIIPIAALAAFAFIGPKPREAL